MKPADALAAIALIAFGLWLLYIVHTLGIIADAIRATIFGWTFIALGAWLLLKK